MAEARLKRRPRRPVAFLVTAAVCTLVAAGGVLALFSLAPP